MSGKQISTCSTFECCSEVCNSDKKKIEKMAFEIPTPNPTVPVLTLLAAGEASDPLVGRWWLTVILRADWSQHFSRALTSLQHGISYCGKKKFFFVVRFWLYELILWGFRICWLPHKRDWVGLFDACDNYASTSLQQGTLQFSPWIEQKYMGIVLGMSCHYLKVVPYCCFPPQYTHS